MAITQYAIEDWRTFDIPTAEGFTSGTAYPDPSTSEVRTQLQSQHSQMKKYVNDTLVPAINNTYTKTETDGKINDAIYQAGSVTPTIVQNMIDDSLAPIESGKQDTLVSGTNIKTVNNTSLLGSGDISIYYFAGIDTANVIYSTTGYIATFPYYTATADGFVVVRQRGRTNHISIDGEDVAGSNSNSDEFGEIWCPIKKGQVLRVYQTGNHAGSEVSNVYVYGLKE